MKQQFWPDETSVLFRMGAKFEIRAELALLFADRWAMVNGKDNGEDSAGRHQITLMPPEEVIDRAFALADAFVDKAVERGEIVVPTLNAEEKVIEVGRLEGIKREAEWERTEAKRIAKIKKED